MDEPLMTNSSGEVVRDVSLVVQGPRDEIERQAMALAQEYFPGPAYMEDAFDPEDPAWQRRVIVVTARGTPKEVVAKELQWIDRLIDEVGPSADNLLLQFRWVEEVS